MALWNACTQVCGKERSRNRMSSEFYFSGGATAKAKETGALTKYRSYKVGTYYDKISERYNFVDIFELQALRVPLDAEKIKYYRENVKEHISTPAGEDGHIIRLSREAYYADQGADHVVLPTQFTAKRFKFASREDLALWEQESSDEEGVIFAGPIAGVAPIREILEKSGEDGLIHPATSDRDEQIRQATDSNGLFYSSEKTINYYYYQENFTPAGPCGHHECGVCYGSLIRFDKPKILYQAMQRMHLK